MNVLRAIARLAIAAPKRVIDLERYVADRITSEDVTA
jgi:hypothetical protein